MSETIPGSSRQPGLPESQMIFDEYGNILPSMQETLLSYYRGLPHAQRISRVDDAMEEGGGNFQAAAKIGQRNLIIEVLGLTVPDKINF